MFGFGSGNSYGCSNGNSFEKPADSAWNTEPQLIFPDAFRRMP